MSVLIAPPAAYIPTPQGKLEFLRGNFKMLGIWLAASLVLAAVGWWALFVKLDRDKRDIENDALKEVAALSRSYADHLGRTMESVDQIALHVKLEWELSKGTLHLEQVRDKGLFPTASTFHVGIVDRNGMLVTSTMPGTGMFVGDREYFRAQQSAFSEFLYIGAPITARGQNFTVIPFSRRLTDREGRFDGVVLVSVAPAYFTTTYDDTILGSNGFMGMVGDDGTVRATRIGSTVFKYAPQALIIFPEFPSPSGNAALDGENWFADDRNRYVGWQRVANFPLTAIVGLDEHDTLMRHWSDRHNSIAYGVAATLALTVFTLIAAALSLRLAWRKRQLDEVTATYRMATEEGNEGFFIARPVRDHRGRIADFQMIDCNHRGAEFFHMRRSDLMAKKLSHVYMGESFMRSMKRLCKAYETGFYEDEIEPVRDGPITVPWLHVRIVRSGTDLAITMRDISESKAHVKALERSSNEDALTGLPNRHWAQHYLPEAIERSARSGLMLAVLFVDLDGFKAVNDTAGHAAGDELLRHAALRLKVSVRPHDHVVRLGGDEFVLIIEQIADRAGAAHVAERAVAAFKEQFKLSQGVYSIGTSIGISMFPTDGQDAGTLLQNADIAMYSVKTGGKAGYRFFDPRFYEALRARLERENELRHALEDDQFVVYYQPRVDIATGATSSMEALVRWQHPVKGLLEPREFIPLAEETGLILGIGEVVFDKVCAQLAVWSRNGEPLVPVSVNISPRQFNDPDIARTFSSSLDRHHVDPALIEIELTESSMIGEDQEVSKALAAIQEMGITLLVDDFGTGYSSLSQLQRLDFDVLKVDRAFTSAIEKAEEGRVFFTAIITMAHALGMRVVAEGVETERQVAILRSMQCDEVQGFFLSRPVAPTDRQPVLPIYRFQAIAS